MDKINFASEVFERLQKQYGKTKCALQFTSPYELLVATILSAQSTDKRVNIVTSELFKVANTPVALSKVSQECLEIIIKPVGIFRSKARSILKMSGELMNRFDGVVPSSREDLESLSGVGKKTAAVVFIEAFGGQAIPVDTHVARVCERVGLLDNALYVAEGKKKIA